MSEHAEDPVGHASSKIVQYVSLATMAAEALAQVRQQRTAAAAAATDERTARALRAQRATALAAARTQWAPVLDAHLRDRTGVIDAGLAWAVAQGWREVDPEAALASDRATERLRELRPDVMERYDRLTADGVEPVEAMRRVAPFMDRPPARPGGYTARPELDTQTSTSRQHYIDTGRYLAQPTTPTPTPQLRAHLDATSERPRSPARRPAHHCHDFGPADRDRTDRAAARQGRLPRAVDRAEIRDKTGPCGRAKEPGDLSTVCGPVDDAGDRGPRLNPPPMKPSTVDNLPDRPVTAWPTPVSTPLTVSEPPASRPAPKSWRRYTPP